jgi:NAD(P)-dependent dehydrogenase (short-subunit alcohol dehydrogenase family)
MVPYADILNSNTSLKSTGASPTAVFIGATSGIGRAALLALAKHTASPKIYVVGRTRALLAPVIDELKGVNPAGVYIPIEGGDLTLLSNVDKASDRIKSHEESHLDMLVLSFGYVTFAGRTESAEGLDKLMSIGYYARMRFLLNLLPLLNAAPSPRVVSVLSAGMEGPLWPEDFALKGKGHYSVINVAGAIVSMTTLFLEEMKKRNPKVVFVHLYPGAVADTKLANRPEHFGWLTRVILMWVLVPVMRVIGYSVQEVGERVLFAATSGRFRAVKGGGEGIEVGSDGTRGSGMYLVMADSSTKEAPKVAKDMREKGVGQKLMDHTTGEFERISNI